jgi:heterodisulfide reductase subunit A2
MTLSNPKVLILGGGLAGITAALALARLGIGVDLLEKTSALGGKVRDFCCKATDVCQQCGACILNDSLAGLSQEPSIQVHLETELREFKKEQKDFLYYFSGPEGAGEGRAEALLVATGFNPFRAEDKPQYRYGILPDVVTGLDLERQIRKTGTILKPSDQTPPRSIAFIQCVGSRDLHLGHPFCSQVCCGYALRMAKLIKYKNPETEVTVFYMDIQTFGKDFPFFMNEVRHQIRLIRAIPGEIQRGAEGQLWLNFQREDSTASERQAFDLVVLSIGLMPNPDNIFLSRLLGIPLTSEGFLMNDQGQASLPPGIFLAGTVLGPKSIGRSIAQSYQAVEELAAYLKASF